MKVTNEKTENSQAYLTIEMETAEVEESLEAAYRRLVQKARIPGFRQGKAPRPILERYLGKESLLEEGLNILLPKAYEKAIKEQGIEPIARPQLEVTQTEPVIFKAVVPLKPTVKLGDYHQIQVTPEPVEVTEENIDRVIEQLRHQNATWEPAERPVELGDLLTFNIQSTIDGKPFINQKGAQYEALHELAFPAPGFADQLVGLQKEEEKEFKLQLPADHPQKELAGKEASFKVTVTEIKREILPELNDDFAAVVNPEYKSVARLREEVTAEMKRRGEERARIDFEERVIDAVAGLAEVAYPHILEEVEIDRMLSQRFQRGPQEMEAYLKSINKTVEDLHEELHPLAGKRVTRSLVLDKVVEAEKIEVSDAEIDTEIENMVASTTDKKEELKQALNTPQPRESIRQTLIGRKAVQLLADIAKSSKETEAPEKTKEAKETNEPKKNRRTKKEERNE